MKLPLKLKICCLDLKFFLLWRPMFCEILIKVIVYENVEDIFKTKECQEFAKNLAEKNMKEI